MSRYEPTPECIIGTTSSDHGYTSVQVGPGKHYPVSNHRQAWINEHGPIPDGMVVRHTCDHPPCVNVDHLVIGTQSDNMRDWSQRGRRPVARGSSPDN